MMPSRMETRSIKTGSIETRSKQTELQTTCDPKAERSVYYSNQIRKVLGEARGVLALDEREFPHGVQYDVHAPEAQASRVVVPRCLGFLNITGFRREALSIGYFSLTESSSNFQIDVRQNGEVDASNVGGLRIAAKALEFLMGKTEGSNFACDRTRPYLGRTKRNLLFFNPDGTRRP